VSSSPSECRRVNKTVFFTANHASYGIELWSLPLAALGASLVENLGVGCPDTGSIVPKSGTVGLPTLGNAAFALEVTQGKASSGALLFFNGSRTDLNLGNGCFSYPTLPWVSFSSLTDSFGRATFWRSRTCRRWSAGISTDSGQSSIRSVRSRTSAASVTRCGR